MNADSNKVEQIERMEWDNPTLNKRDWPLRASLSPWLNEPDKVQFMSSAGYPCLIVRSHHGAFCGYVAVPSTHPAFGYSYQGFSQLIADIISEQHRESLIEWGKSGHPKDKDGFPDVNLSTPDTEITPIGQSIIDIRVHGGLTYSGSPILVSEVAWTEFLEDFPKAKEKAKLFPSGDAARWLHIWGPAEHSFEEFKNICRSQCTCFEPPDNEVWLFGFDCAHAGDRTPAIEAQLRAANFTLSPYDKLDEYRTIEYVEEQCEKLAKQLKDLD